MQKNQRSFEFASSLILAASFILLAFGFLLLGVTWLPVIGILAGFMFLGMAYFILRHQPVVRNIEVIIGAKAASYLKPEAANLSGVIPVAILSTSTAAGEAQDFDATTVIGSSVRFGPNRVEPLDNMADPAAVAEHLRDVDGDGDMDFVFAFPKDGAGIGLDDEVCITGSTTKGEIFRGCGPLRLVEAA
jgi:hypothetical protein